VLYRGQQAGVLALFWLVMGSDTAISYIQEDGRLYNALVQLTTQVYKTHISPSYALNLLLLLFFFVVIAPLPAFILLDNQ